MKIVLIYRISLELNVLIISGYYIPEAYSTFENCYPNEKLAQKG